MNEIYHIFINNNILLVEHLLVFLSERKGEHAKSTSHKQKFVFFFFFSPSKHYYDYMIYCGKLCPDAFQIQNVRTNEKQGFKTGLQNFLFLLANKPIIIIIIMKLMLSSIPSIIGFVRVT